MFTKLYLLGKALKKSALVQGSKNTITHTSKLKLISKYQILRFICKPSKTMIFNLYLTLKQVKHNSRTLCRSR